LFPLGFRSKRRGKFEEDARAFLAEGNIDAQEDRFNGIEPKSKSHVAFQVSQVDVASSRCDLSMLIDRDYLAEKVWSNTMIPSYSFVPPGVSGYETRTTDYAEMSQIDREDEAKKILEELGYTPEHPLKMEIRYNTSENHKNTAVAIQEQLKPLGVEVTLIGTGAERKSVLTRA
jgi:hypothetical protein